MSEDRCRGDCCRRFYLIYTPEELRRRADEMLKAMAEHDTMSLLGQRGYEVPIIADMVIPLPDDVDGVALDCNGERQPEQEPGHYYTCRNLQPNGDCGIYVTRPIMCREFPMYETARRCEYRDCQWRAVKRDLPVPIPQAGALDRWRPCEVGAAYVWQRSCQAVLDRAQSHRGFKKDITALKFMEARVAVGLDKVDVTLAFEPVLT